jgi:zinc/manganese transport system permease protein
MAQRGSGNEERAGMNAVTAVAGSGIADLFAHPFVRNALLAGTGIALASGLVGYFLVLRSQVFSGDALSHVAFTGSVAALAFGLDVRLGLFAATVGVGLLLGFLGPRGEPDDVVIGTVFTWVLGLGVLFLAIFVTDRSTGFGTAGTTILFGSIFGLSASQASLAAWIGLGASVAVIALARPLLSPPSIPTWRARTGCACARSASCSSGCSASARPRRPRPWAPSSSSGSSPRPRARPNG